MQRLLTLTITNFTVSTRTAILLIASVDFVEATMTSEELTTREAVGDAYCFNKSCNGEQCEFFDAHVTTSTSIYVCGAWSLVHKVPFTKQQHIKLTKTDKQRYFVKNEEFVTWPANVHQSHDQIDSIKEKRNVQFVCGH